VQLEGSKTWEMYKSIVRRPDMDQRWPLTGDDFDLLGEPSETIVLEEGGVLYVPRGAGTHRVLATKTNSSFQHGEYPGRRVGSN
jgi:ribosomal protein L16 Arg81 hydroxylase